MALGTLPCSKSVFHECSLVNSNIIQAEDTFSNRTDFDPGFWKSLELGYSGKLPI
jgi:hypothetical protein